MLFDFGTKLSCMRVASTALLLFSLTVGFAASPTQTRSDDEPECTKEGVRKLQLTRDDTTILGLTIGTASMKDVEAILGGAHVLPLHGSASASHIICYVSPTDGTVLTLGTNGMGGFVDLVEFGIWAPEAKFPDVSACSHSKLVSRDLSTVSGIRLGLSLKQLSHIVGKRAAAPNAKAHYQLWCRQKMTPEEIRRFETSKGSGVAERPYFDVSSFVYAHFTSSGVSQIDIAKTVSY
jgi:hypothetical protein